MLISLTSTMYLAQLIWKWIHTTTHKKIHHIAIYVNYNVKLINRFVNSLLRARGALENIFEIESLADLKVWWWGKNLLLVVTISVKHKMK